MDRLQTVRCRCEAVISEGDRKVVRWVALGWVLLGFAARTELRDGVKKLIAWRRESLAARPKTA